MCVDVWASKLPPADVLWTECLLPAAHHQSTQTHTHTLTPPSFMNSLTNTHYSVTLIRIHGVKKTWRLNTYHWHCLHSNAGLVMSPWFRETVSARESEKVRDRVEIKRAKTKSESEGHQIPSTMLDFSVILKQRGKERWRGWGRGREGGGERDREIYNPKASYPPLSSGCEEVRSLEDFRGTTGPSEVTVLFSVSKDTEKKIPSHTYTLTKMWR